MATHTIRLSKITQQQIDKVQDFLDELSYMAQELKMTDLEDLDLSSLKILSKFDQSAPESFIESIVSHIDRMPYSKLIANLITLLDNCADPECDVLDFNKDIKKGFELLHERETANDFSLEYCI